MDSKVAHRGGTGATRERVHWRLVALMACLLLVAAACGSDGGDGDKEAGQDTTPPTSQPAEGEPVRGGTVTIGLEAETNSWLPGEATFSTSGQTVANAIYDSLMKRGADGEVHPYLAKSLEPNEDLTEWTLRLRPDVSFHDGTPLDAEALKSNFDGQLKGETSTLLGTLSDVERMEVVDDLTVKYVLTAGNAAFPDLLTGSAGMPFSPAAVKQHGADAGSNPVGTGPFVFQDWQRDSQLEMTRNKDYWREDLPYLDEIVFRVIVDDDARVASLRSGDINMMHSGRIPVVRELRELEDVETYEALGNSGSNFIVNTEQPPVDDPRVRRALAYAMDQELLIDVFGGAGLVPPQTQYFSEESPWFSEDVAEAFPNNDPAAARELLDDYINDPGRSDGKPVGSPVVVEFDHTQSSGVAERAQALQAMWNAVGVEVQLAAVEQATHIQNVIAGDYQIASWRSGSDADPYTVLSQEFGPPEATPTNYSNFTHPVLDKQLEILRTNSDFDTRYTAVEEIMMLFTEQVPNLWAGGIRYTVAALPGVQGVGEWTLPDGGAGEAVPGATVMWPQIWIEE